MILLHAGADGRTFTIPHFVRGKQWRLFVDTAAAPPNDIYPNLDGPLLPPTGILELEGRSLMCYVAE